MSGVDCLGVELRVSAGIEIQTLRFQFNRKVLVHVFLFLFVRDVDFSCNLVKMCVATSCVFQSNSFVSNTI